MALSILDTKILLLSVMLVVTFAAGFLPVAMVGVGGSGLTSRRGRNTITLLSCYAGGVFLAACLMDLFPDVRESIDHVLGEIGKKYNVTIDYPVAEFVIMSGFFLIWFVETAFQMLKNREIQRQQQGAAAAVNVAAAVVDENSPLLVRRAVGVVNQDASGSSCSSSLRHSSDKGQKSYQSDTTSSTPHQHEDLLRDQEEQPPQTPAPEHGGLGHSHSPVELLTHSSFRSYLLLIALSFHSLFEGLAIGLQKELGSLLSLFLAVMFHKAIMAVSLGLAFVVSNLSKKKILIFNLIFSLASPIGIGLGIAVSDVHSIAGDLASGILQGIACGTFLYISLFEVLVPEISKPTPNNMWKILAAVIGWASIAILMIFAC